MKNKYKVEMVS